YLVRRSQHHQATLVGHVDVFSGDTARRLADWTRHFVRQGSDTFTAGRRATSMLFNHTVTPAQGLAHAGRVWILSSFFFLVLIGLPWMGRVRAERATSGERGEGLPTAVE